MKRADDYTLRAIIIDSYCRTDFYLDLKNQTQNKINYIAKSNSTFTLTDQSGQKQKEKWSIKIEKEISSFNESTFIKHDWHYDEKQNKVIIVEPIWKSENLPYTIKNQDLKSTLELQFDLRYGIGSQLKNAERKLKEAQRKLKKNPFNKISTSRRTIDDVSQCLFVMATRDEMKRKDNATWKTVAKHLEMAESNAKSKYQKAHKLIRNKEIRSYFPAQIPTSTPPTIE